VCSSELAQEQRNLIADRMDGIDVLKLCFDKDKRETFKGYNHSTPWEPALDKVTPEHITADEPTFDALMEAILKNQKEIEAEQAKKSKVTSVNTKES